MPISQDEQERLDGTRIAEMLEKTSIWSQESIDSREPHKDDFDRFVNLGYALDKEDYINRYVLSARLARDKHKLELNRTYKLIDPTDKYEQLATLSFDKKEFRPSMIDALVASLRRKCPKPIDYDTAIIRPEFNASSQDDPSFNPHVHIYTPKVQKASAVANALNKRFVSCKLKMFQNASCRNT